MARLTETWRAEHERWSQRDLSAVDYVYVWADGVYVNVRLPDADGHQDRLCLLVIVGVRPDGRKELVAVADGHREDTESWLDVLRGLRDRGMAALAVAVGDGALGFWAALWQVFTGKSGHITVRNGQAGLWGDTLTMFGSDRWAVGWNDRSCGGGGAG